MHANVFKSIDPNRVTIVYEGDEISKARKSSATVQARKHLDAPELIGEVHGNNQRLFIYEGTRKVGA